MPPVNQIVLVGHCMPDVFMLKSAIGRMVDGVDITSANSQSELDKVLTSDALLLVNRALDGEFDAADGIKLIEQLSSRRSTASTMLISDQPDAQVSARQAGAAPGFGKSQLGDPDTAQKLNDALGR